MILPNPLTPHLVKSRYILSHTTLLILPQFVDKAGRYEMVARVSPVILVLFKLVLCDKGKIPLQNNLSFH